jgi:hypothetical protein
MAQQLTLEPAPPHVMPGAIDSNSPAVRWNGKLLLFNSSDVPVRSEGTWAEDLGRTRAVLFDKYKGAKRWIESAWIDEDGTIYAWYHHEPGPVCGDGILTEPAIGALVSTDGGRFFTDLGLVLSSGYPTNCEARNGYFSGGHGDFSVILDRERQYFYFFFTNYGGPAEAHGVAVARMPFAHRANPAGQVQKYFQGSWSELGLGGRVTPVFQALQPWSSEYTDSFWGPSVHWNHALGRFVMLLNRSCCEAGWPQEGIYLAFAPDLSQPEWWSTPQRLMDGEPGWYPQLIGLGEADTDSEVGESARLYVFGESRWILRFQP